ncbi:hypothetical protein KUC_3855 [Vreelandella boliviensis LC1]|uniref:Uncharacterized protein n=1 Tax=Vreelandella boliviensis LC1 TaxID=1072583 RepID=A0A7U9GEE2_9GAMM|nr:hypothetical protein KUC_3855 [Halomonas boliviensis LC1]
MTIFIIKKQSISQSLETFSHGVTGVHPTTLLGPLNGDSIIG